MDGGMEELHEMRVHMLTEEVGERWDAPMDGGGEVRDERGNLFVSIWMDHGVELSFLYGKKIVEGEDSDDVELTVEEREGL